MPPKRNATDDLTDLRQRSRFDYLAKREALKLAELQKDVEEDEREREKYGSKLSKKELAEMDKRKMTLRLTMERNQIDDTNSGFFMLDSTLTDKSEVLTKRSKKDNYKSEVQLWEEEQTSKARAAQGQQRVRESEDEYEYVFDPQTQINFVGSDANVLDPDKQRLQAQLVEAESRAKSIADVRSSLPIHAYKKELFEAFEAYPTIIVTAETGSGKSSQLPQYMLEYLNQRQDSGLIICTQPRRVAAISLATRVAEEHGTRLGNEIGYTIRFEDKTSEKTRIKYVTDGTLLRMFLTEPDLKNVSCIMLDEAHERTLATDILMALLKDVQKQHRNDLKIIVSSATLDAQAFSTYFDSCPVLFIPGRTFPVSSYHSTAPEANYLSAVCTTVFQIHTSVEDDGGILVFLTGQEEIESALQNLEETRKKLGNRVKELVVLPLYSALPPEEQSLIFNKTPPGVRKVILATNIAETSLTIDGIVYVIDTGFSKENQYNNTTKMESLSIVPISRASANQRAGRAGRTGPGKCFRLFTAHAFNNDLSETSEPEILRVNLCPTILLLKSIGVNDLLNFPFMTPPAPESIASSLETLYCLGALDSKGSITKVGRSLAELPISPEQGKTLISSSRFGCLNSVLTIIAMLGEANSLFFAPKDKKLHLDAAKRRFYVKGLGDYGAYLAIYNGWQESEFSVQFCQESFLQIKTLNRVRNVREQLEKLCEKIGLTPEDEEELDHVAIKKSFCAGFFANSARLGRDGQSYRPVKGANSITVWIHPSSYIHEPSERPRWLLYSELVLTSKEFMRSVLPIEPEYLTELAPFYFKEGDIEKLGDKKASKGKGKVGVD
jgi:pre-mRNA-splicing factor ATP-dependent RNA helicase DHX16